ncbi:MAG: hypothetical protein M3352_07205 [Bacteroidota bacterium]|nr:hypothetical protein [Bacteroidota bacterium]
MTEQAFYQAVNDRANEACINPLLLISGIEGLYTFREVELSNINYIFLDSLILTIFALRVGEQFHVLAEEKLSSTNDKIMQAAAMELSPLSKEEIDQSSNRYLQSFAHLLKGNSIIRGYHIKALEVAALEIKKAQLIFKNNSISSIVMIICKSDVNGDLGLASLFNQ